ncbi:ABC transporter substrate-binding protein [Halomicronema sp. CCY15110]|uniref:substrate-binding periplasmic protein n=1 Tax=Halomicronema sp. CCY15110 TaxID=2767773 RepID=UPI001950B9D2|nr:transporter substrate-binding domain-containing protein [Halomicronema sp. CCY15110]
MYSCFFAPQPLAVLARLLKRCATISVCCLLLWGGGSSLTTPTAIAAQPPTVIAQTNRSAAASDQASRSAAAAVNNEQAEIALMPPDIQRIVDRGKLIVAVLGNSNAPFFMTDETGQAAGLDIQLAQALADQLGVDLELNRSPDTFNAVVDTVYYRGADMAISKISRTMKRAVRVRFSHPYLTMRQGLLINRLLLAQQTNSDNVIETIRELTGDVGVIKGSSYVGFLQQRFPQASIVELDSWEDIVTAVSQGDILAGYRDELEIKKVVKTKPDAALQLKTAVLTDTQDALAMVFPWESAHLLAFANQYLDTLDAEYTVDSILEEFATYLNTQPPTL